MQINGREQQLPPDHVAVPQIKNHGPCSRCKQHLSQLKLGPFLKHQYHCKGGISQKKVSCPSPGSYTNSHLSPKKQPHSSFSKAFGQTDSLKSPSLICTAKMPYVCSWCDKRFMKKSALVRHQRRHMDERPFECTYCDKCFRLRGTLKEHVRIHTGEKPYKCSQCDKRFTQQSTLTDHYRIHTGERPHGCSLCNKRFSRQGSLKKHLLIHTGETPYKCKKCDKRFKEKGALTKHQRTHTGDKPFKCEWCDKTFGYRRSLKLHMFKHREQPFMSVEPAPVGGKCQ